MTYFRAQITDDGTEWLVPEPRARSGWGGRGQLRGTGASWGSRGVEFINTDLTLTLTLANSDAAVDFGRA